MNALQTEKLTKQFGGIRAVDNLSISLRKGAITSIIGPNGSGKTTLTNLLSGMTSLDFGTVVFEVRLPKEVGLHGVTRILPHEAPALGITRTFQEVRLFEQMSVLDNLLVVLTERKVFASLFEPHTKKHLEQAQKLLEEARLWEKREEYASELSYGQRKCLEIARARAMDAEIFLFDEPFAGLFPEMKKQVVEIIKGLRREGKTVVLIEHNMELVRELSDWVIVMDEGKLLAEGKPEEILKRSEVVEAYLGD